MIDYEMLTSHYLSSMCLIYCNRPTLPISKQATGNLLKKAVAAAHHSVKKPALSSSLKYDPTSPPSPIRSHSYEEKQQQKELLLQQHRELQKHFLQMKHQDVSDVETVAVVESVHEMEEEIPTVQESIQEEVDENERKHDSETQKEENNVQEPEVILLKGFSIGFEVGVCPTLRTVPTIVIAHTFCASPDTRISYRRCLLIQGYFCAV